MEPVPQALLNLVKKAAPPEAEIMPLPWAFEKEDYNLAVVMPDAVDRLAARQIEDRLLDVIMDYDEAHDTFTVCKVWRAREMARQGCCENCWDSGGKRRRFWGNGGERYKAGSPKEIRGLEAFSRRC